MIVIPVVTAALLLLLAWMAYAAWSVTVQTRDVGPDVPGPGGGGGGGGGGPETDGPFGGGGPGLDLETSWTLQDDVDVHLLLSTELRH